MKPNRPILLCAQGLAGWGHLKRMLVLKRVLDALRSSHGFPRVYISVTSHRRVTVHSQTEDKELFITSFEALLHKAERASFIVFPNLSTRTEWILKRCPQLIIWDVREYGLGVLSQLVRSNSSIQLVLDSRSPIARRAAHYLITSLPALEKVSSAAKNGISRVQSSSGFIVKNRFPNQKLMKMKPDNAKTTWITKPRQANLALNWELLLNDELRELSDSRAPQKYKQDLRQQHSVIRDVLAAQQEFFLVYIGTIQNKTYWRRVYAQVLALFYYRVFSIINAHMGKKKRKDKSSGNRSQIQAVSLKSLSENLTSFLPSIFVVIDENFIAECEWKQFVLKEQRHYATRLRTVDKETIGPILENQLQLQTHFIKNLAEREYRLLIQQATWMVTHPGLSAQHRLYTGRPILVTAPTPYLTAIGQTFFKNFFYSDAKTLRVRVSEQPVRVMEAFERSNIRQACKVKAHLQREQRKAPKLLDLLLGLLQRTENHRSCPSCHRGNSASRSTSIVTARYQRFNVLECLTCKNKFKEILLS